MLPFLRKKRGRKREPLPEERERFIRIYKKFLDTFITIFYPIRLEWWELLIISIFGMSFGLGISYVFGLLIKKFLR